MMPCQTFSRRVAFNVAAQQEENTGVEAEPIYEETHEASSVAGGDETGADNSKSDDDNEGYDAAPETRGEEI
ncbi:hypothetical protein FPCIR_8308 [Fusarium pseudocircinatum]|uniref:Uncharacterized protein n=1 Tax=Fusarium pseudocircinatum TaxID=56676 RepID=A0A8H5L7B1_9HYPO|nr:hypothetical protein FPCIR_8308 [Fusarium pseudocircinatum]